jgi:hypothetical protein
LHFDFPYELIASNNSVEADYNTVIFRSDFAQRREARATPPTRRIPAEKLSNSSFSAS